MLRLVASDLEALPSWEAAGLAGWDGDIGRAGWMDHVTSACPGSCIRGS